MVYQLRLFIDTQSQTAVRTAVNGTGTASMAMVTTRTNRVWTVSLLIGARGLREADGARRGLDLTRGGL